LCSHPYLPAAEKKKILYILESNPHHFLQF